MEITASQVKIIHYKDFTRVIWENHHNKNIFKFVPVFQWFTNQWTRKMIDSYRWSLKINRLKFKTLGKLPIIFRRIYRVYLKLIQKNQKITTWTWKLQYFDWSCPNLPRHSQTKMRLLFSHSYWSRWFQKHMRSKYLLWRSTTFNFTSFILCLAFFHDSYHARGGIRFGIRFKYMNWFLAVDDLSHHMCILFFQHLQSRFLDCSMLLSRFLFKSNCKRIFCIGNIALILLILTLWFLQDSRWN